MKIYLWILIAFFLIIILSLGGLFLIKKGKENPHLQQAEYKLEKGQIKELILDYSIIKTHDVKDLKFFYEDNYNLYLVEEGEPSFIRFSSIVNEYYSFKVNIDGKEKVLKGFTVNDLNENEQPFITYYDLKGNQRSANYYKSEKELFKNIEEDIYDVVLHLPKNKWKK